MPKQRLFTVYIALFLITLACSFSTIDTSVIDQVATAASFAQGDGSIASVVAASATAEVSIDSVDTPEPTQDLTTPRLRVAYVDDGDLWLWTEGVGTEELFHGPVAVSDVLFSDDGQLIVFRLGDALYTGDLWVISVDGSNPRPLLDASILAALAAAGPEIDVIPKKWSFVPGTHILAFNTALRFEVNLSTVNQDDLHLIDIDTGLLTKLLEPDLGGHFDFSPDGSQVAILTPTSLSLVDADGANRRDAVLTFEAAKIFPHDRYYPVPRWSTDGSHLRIVIPAIERDASGLLDASTSIWEISADGEFVEQIGEYTALPSLSQVDSPLSPDLVSYAFLEPTANRENDTNLFVIEAGQLTDMPYHAAPVIFRGWAPDSAHFIFQEDSSLFLGGIGELPELLMDTENLSYRHLWVDEERILFGLIQPDDSKWILSLQTLEGETILIASPTGENIAFDSANP